MRTEGRNERGLSVFLRSLQSMLSLLIDDLSSNARPISGLPVETRETVVALKRDISVVMNYISEIIHNEQAESHQQQEDVYRSHNAEGNHNFGRPYFDITRDQLEHLRSIDFTWKQIAKLLNISYSTVKRRRKDYRMDERRFSSVTDDELDAIYPNLTKQEGSNLGTTNLGRRRFLVALTLSLFVSQFVPPR